jgi:tRNA G18 (ribose-2'-O)-methylase SpoU
MPENVLKKEEKIFILENAIEIEEEFFDKLIPYKTRSKVLAIAKKPEYILEKISETKPIVFLENPANPENIGMVLRICAAFGIGALVVSGRNNPFSASVLRAGAGLIYAVPTFHREFSKEIFEGRKIIIADAEGESIKKNIISKNSVIIFGTEREGVSENLKNISDKILKLDMENNVSSLNLATSVSAFLYGGNFG